MAADRDRTSGGMSGGRWSARGGVAMLLRASIWLVPLVVSVAVAVVAATVLPVALTVGGHIAWWAGVLGSSIAALVVTDRLLRRALPLAALLDVSLAFPHRPPSRFSVLRRVHSIDELRARVRDGDGDSASAAADLLALVLALDEHDRATRGHSERVRLYAELLGEELDLDEDALDRLRWAALLHDIGKLTVPAEILNKGDHLEDEEWDRIRRHPTAGARLVEPLRGWMGPWVGAIEHHHEHVDGTGYPHGLEGSRIALGGRIVAIADAFETMTASRPYKRPLTIGAARQELVASSGTHFDEHLVRSFVNLSIPRLRHIAGWAAWIASMPGLALLRRVPGTSGNGVVAAAAVGVLAVTGSIGPAQPPPVEPGERIAQPAPEGEGAGPQASGDRSASSPPNVDGPPSGEQLRRDDGPPPDDARSDDGPPTDDGPAGDDGPAADEPASQDDGSDREPDDPPSESPDGTGGQTPDRGTERPEGSRRDTRQVGHEEATVVRRLYLHTASVDGVLRHDVLPLDGRAPDRTSLDNYDVDVDDDPGLRLPPTDRGRNEERVTHRQRWAADLGAPTTLAGTMSVTVWASIPEDGAENGSEDGAATVSLEGYVDHCTGGFTDCQPISAGTSGVRLHAGTWEPVTIDLPLGSAVMLDDRVLALTLVTGPSSDSDVLVAFDTAPYPAALDTAAGVIASPQLPAGAAAVAGAGRGQ